VAISYRMEKTLIKTGISFDRQKGKFLLSVGELHVQQNICEFLQTMSYLVGKNIEEYLMSTDSQHDTIRVPLTNTGTTVTLDLKEFIGLREAYSRQMFLLKLEDLLLHKGIQSSRLF
jgi:hypothetical protein